MRQILIKGSLGIFFTVLAGCGGDGSAPPAAPSPNAATPAAPAAPATPVAVAPAAAPKPAAVPVTSTAPVPPGLAPSTNPDRREQAVKTGRTNPFVPPVPVPVSVSIQQATTGKTNSSSLPKLPTQTGQSVASLPDLPVGIGPSLPPGSRNTKATSASPGGRGGTTGPLLPGTQAAQVPGLPQLPPVIGPKLPPNVRPATGRQTAQAPQSPGVQVPGLPQLPPAIGPNLPPKQVARANTPGRSGASSPTASGNGRGNTPGGPTASGNGGSGPVAAKPAPPAPPSLPKAEGQQVPSLPTLPPSIGPALPPAPPTPPSAVPNSPPPPNSDLAKAVEVTGVVQVGNETQIIVKAPNEATSRYVKVGQRLSNGEILVKRVITGSGSEPIIILEQNGVEVAKAVGEKPATAEKSSQPTS
ncbi:MAG TPA: hypothetical protein V6D13_07070 [Halomicronema sp.]